MKGLFKIRTLAALLTLYVALIAGTTASAQELIWETAIGGPLNDQGEAALVLDDGSVVAVGSTFAFGRNNFDIYLVKVDDDGSTVFTKRFGGDSTDYGYDLCSASGGGFMIAGATKSSGAGGYDILLIRCDEYGTQLWERTLGGPADDRAGTIRPAPGGGFFVGGSTASSGSGYDDYYLARLDSLGVPVWQRTFGGAGGDVASELRVTPDGDVLIVGSTGSFGEGYSSILVVRVSANGDSLWSKVYGTPGADFAYGLTVTGDGGFVIAGAASQGPNFADALLIRCDPWGNEEWSHTYGGSYDDRAYAVEEAPSGDLILAGRSESFAPTTKMYLVRTDPAGTEMWSRSFGGAKSDFCQALALSPTLDYLLVGYSYSSSLGGSDVYLVKVSGDQITDIQAPYLTAIPDGFELQQNYPNPFNASTVIEFSLPARSSIRLTIHDILGRTVARWETPDAPAGTYRHEWDGTGPNGSPAASGIYLYRLETKFGAVGRKMVLVK